MNDLLKETHREIVCIHQGYELYGSDRTFISSLTAFRENYPESNIIAIIPREGQLSQTLRNLGFSVEVEELWVLRKSLGITENIKSLIKLPKRILAARKRLKNARFHYINTSVILDYAIASRFCKRPGFIHIHEIAPKKINIILRTIAKISGAKLIYNSAASKLSLNLEGDIVPNGAPNPKTYTNIDGDKIENRNIKILMIGRINRWKGQDLLLKAISKISPNNQAKINLRIVGDVFESDNRLQKLRYLLEKLSLQCNVSIEGFANDTEEIYKWADIVTVPSKDPEPFGLVAIEAMSHARTVLCAKHGGLMEIVTDNEDGLFFIANDTDDLACKIEFLIRNRNEIVRLGTNGRKTFCEKFTEPTYQNRLVRCIDRALTHK